MIPLQRCLTACLLLAVVIFTVGCTRKAAEPTKDSPTPPSKAASIDTPADDADAVKAIEAITDKVRRDGDGRIIEVDFRGQTIDDSIVLELPKLPRLRSVLLSGTGITDEALKSLGNISTLENLDLRDCGVSDAGLAHLSSLAKLKALKLSGRSGACSVSDDGMEHVAKLPNLKVLAVDSLWISEDGLSKIVGLANLSELYMAETTIGNEAIELLASFPS